MATKDERALLALRRKIDGVDSKLLALLSERGRLVEQVGRSKRSKGASFHRPEREREVLARLVEKNRGPYPDEAIEGIYREVMSASLALESPLTVAVGDAIATRAARRRFGSAAKFLSREDVLDAVARGFAHYGVLVVEDSRAGFAGAALDALAEAEVPVTGEILLPANGVVTRALVVGGEEPKPTGDDQTSVLLVPRDEPGAVAGVLAAFGKRGVNLRRIEARPARPGAKRVATRWAYQFFADLEGHRADAPLARALSDLAKGGALVRVLGSYPRGRTR